MEAPLLYHPLPVSMAGILTLAEHQQLYEVVSVAVQSDLFAALAEPKSAVELAREKHWETYATECLLDVLFFAGLVQNIDGFYSATAAAATYLHPDSLWRLNHLFENQERPGSLAWQLRQCLAADFQSRGRHEPDWNAERLRQIGVMGLNGSLQATVASVDLAGISSLLDLGGGHGFYSIALAQKYPELRVTLFDLPPATSLARELVDRFGLADRVTCVAGNFLTDDIGTGYDAVLCANILHGDKRDTVLPKVFAALRPGGRLIVKCRVADGVGSLQSALARLVWLTRGGKEMLRQAEWLAFLAQHGFRSLRTVNVWGIFATITGLRP